MKTITFFNNKGGVGKTSLVYHLAYMYADLGVSVVAADLDPQANLSSMFLDEDRLEALWPDGDHPRTIFGAMQPLLDGIGDIAQPHVEPIDDNLGLLVGDLGLSLSESELSSQWPKSMDREPRAFRVLSAFWRLLESAAAAREAGLVLIDVGPNLGAVNRAALIAAEHVVIPLAPDLYSLQGLRNLGPRLRDWRGEWRERRDRNPVVGLSIPAGAMAPAGYVVMQHAVRLDRPVRAYERWMERIPRVYREAVLGEPVSPDGPTVATDPHCLATLKHYRSLMPLAQEARKPMFALKPADGAIGGHAQAVQDTFRDFRALAVAIAGRCGLHLP
ncbi:chromosome partitioning protein [bacterium]|nr:ParA family protein [Chloroflexi bacterium CFX6]RIL10722.1 MAG: chromosome partitioning protein [bacterium]